MPPFTPSKSKPISFNAPLYGVAGSFALGNAGRVPYTFHAMSLPRALEELSLMDELTPTLDHRWSLAELFQREIDMQRITDEMVKGYILDPLKLKYFNALTVVLMPKPQGGHVPERFGDPTELPVIPTDGEDQQWAEGEDRSFGGVQFHAHGEFARLRWRPELVGAMVVDGQHRLHALRETKRIRGGFSEEEKRTNLPVMVVLIDERAGFVHASTRGRSSDVQRASKSPQVEPIPAVEGGAATSPRQNWSISEVARELFTHLNQRAKPVGPARELILDDWSITARCTRSLVTEEAATDNLAVGWAENPSRSDGGEKATGGSEVMPGGGDNGEKVENPDSEDRLSRAGSTSRDEGDATEQVRNESHDISDAVRTIPLTMVRWQEDISRFDHGYFINSIVNLAAVVDLVLELQTPVDPLDTDEVKKFIESINNALAPGRELEYEIVKDDGGSVRVSLGKYFRDNYFVNGKPDEQERPFSRLPDVFLQAAVAGFREHHHPWLLRLLTEFEPYAEVMSYARKHDLISGLFGQYLAQTETHRKVLNTDLCRKYGNDWYKERIEKHIEEIEAIKGKSEAEAHWAFKTVFQKAMVILAKQVEFECKGSVIGTIDSLLETLGHLNRAGLLKVRSKLEDAGNHELLWEFIAINPGNQKIKVKKATETQVASLLRLWHFGSIVQRRLPAVVPAPVTGESLYKYLMKDGTAGEFPDCKDSLEAVKKGLHHELLWDRKSVSDDVKAKRVKERLCKLLDAGLTATKPPDASSAENVSNEGSEGAPSVVAAEGEDERVTERPVAE